MGLRQHIFRYVLLCVGAVLAMGDAAVAQSGVPLASVVGAKERKAFIEERSGLLKSVRTNSFARGMELTDAESILDRRLLALRREALSNTVSSKTLPELPFLEIRPLVETNLLYQIIRQMPKGGLLHAHELTLGRAEWLATNAAKRSDCYIRWPADAKDSGRGTLAFGAKSPGGDYRPAAELWGCITNLKEVLCNAFLMVHGSNGEAGWDRFGQCYTAASNVRTYAPVYEAYIQDAFEQLCEDRCSYLELRVLLDGEPTNDVATVQQMWKIRNRVREKYPEFDLKLILCGLRTGKDTSAVTTVMHRTCAVRRDTGLTNFIAGVDWVGREDGGRRTFLDGPTIIEELKECPDLKLFLHDGESAWDVDQNVVDAIALKPARIGHAFNLFRFGVLEDIAKRERIVLEICPISNQLLELTRDLRTHPAPGYFARGLHCVLASDDPLLFGNNQMSYEFAMAHIAWGLHLEAIKQLARNSLQYSELSAPEKKKALAKWHADWEKWVDWANQRLASEGI